MAYNKRHTVEIRTIELFIYLGAYKSYNYPKKEIVW